MSEMRSIYSRIRSRLAGFARRRRFSRAIRHLHGQGFSVPQDAVLAIVLVRDGAYYLDAFFEYYRSMGIRHFAFIDNGSSDETVARIKAEPDCVIDRAVLPLAEYEDLMRAYPAQTYGKNRWCLYVDMDEQFDFIGRKDHGIQGLISYLAARGDTALMAQMLEMFPVAPLQDLCDLPFAQAVAQFDHYDISTVDSYPYHSTQIPFHALLRDNRLSDPAFAFKFGGVRGRVFGETCCLTKHPLVFNGGDVRIAPHPHLSCNVVVSDMVALVRHYKFAGNIGARDAASARSGALDHGEDAARLAVMERTQGLSLHSEAAQRWAGLDPLYDQGFLSGAAGFRAHLAARAS